MGTTVHYLAPQFDSGNILCQVATDIGPQESAYALFERLARLGSEALDDAVRLALEQDAGAKQDLSNYSYFSHPTLKSYLDLRRKGHRLVRLRELLRSVRTELGNGRAADQARRPKGVSLRRANLNNRPLACEPHRGPTAMNRLFDVTLAAGALVVLAPVLAVIAIAVRLSSPARSCSGRPASGSAVGTSSSTSFAR